MKAWRDQGLTLSVIAVNLSLHQLKHGQALIDDVTETLKKWGLPPSDLEFDVTEATLAQLKWTSNDVLPRLHELGSQDRDRWIRQRILVIRLHQGVPRQSS